MPIDLSNRKWPVRDEELLRKPETRELITSAYRTFVNEGSLYVRTVDFNGLMRPIPRESSFITALGHENGIVYGATSGQESWLFQFALQSFRECAAPIGPIPNCNEVRALLVKDSSVYIAANNNGEGRLIKTGRIGLPGDVIQEWVHPRAKYEDIMVPVPGDKIVQLVASNLDSNLLYGLTEPSGTLFRFALDEGKVDVVGPVDPVNFFGKVLVEDSSGYVHAFGTVGKMMTYDPHAKSISYSGITIPCLPGRGPYAKITAAVYDPVANRLVVGDSEGLVSIVDLSERKVIALGKPVALGGIDHLVRIEDGRVFGLAGGLDGMSHLFVQCSKTGSLRDLGVCCATVEKAWYGYKFGGMVATPGGRIVMGEDDHLGSLFSYYPAIV